MHEGPTPPRPGSADLSRTVAVVPVRGLESAKTRLGEALDPEERRDLVVQLIERTVGAAVSAGLTTVVVSPDSPALSIAAAAGASALPQRSRGLNEALEEARSWALAAGATAILVLSVDLPAIDRSAVEDVLGRARAGLVAGHPLLAIVPDRHGLGTNALLVSPPAAIGFAFGIESRARHIDAARDAGAAVVEIGGPLTLDLDTADDLALAEPLLLSSDRAR